MPDSFSNTSALTSLLPFFQTCLKTCYQSYVIAECGCGDPKIPINTRATRVRAANQTKSYSSCLSFETGTYRYKHYECGHEC